MIQKAKRIIDFNFAIPDAGEWDVELRRGFVNPQMCKDVRDIVDTLVHEQLHQILTDEFATTTDQDHWAIDKIHFQDIYLIE